LLLDALNKGQFNKEILLISGALVTAGVLLKLLIFSWLKAGGKRRLWIIQK
jgi:hypothetical protein